MHEMIRVGDLTVTVLKSGHDTDNQFCLFEFAAPPHDAMLLPHLHLDYDETVVGIQGITRWRIGREYVTVGPGERVLIPRGVAHSYSNRLEYSARWAAIYTPGVVDPLVFRELAHAATLSGPDRIASMGAVMARFRTIPASDN